MPVITIAATPQFADGTYVAELTSVTQKTIEPKIGAQAGQKVDIYEWRFKLSYTDGAPLLDEDTEEPIVGRATSSLASGPSSKLSGFLVALLGPSAVEPGAQHDTDDWIGKLSMATVVHDKGGYPQVDALSAMPRTRRAAAAPVAEAKVEAETETKAEGEDDLPW